MSSSSRRVFAIWNWLNQSVVEQTKRRWKVLTFPLPFVFLIFYFWNSMSTLIMAASSMSGIINRKAILWVERNYFLWLIQTFIAILCFSEAVLLQYLTYKVRIPFHIPSMSFPAAQKLFKFQHFVPWNPGIKLFEKSNFLKYIFVSIF